MRKHQWVYGEAVLRTETFQYRCDASVRLLRDNYGEKDDFQQFGINSL